MKTLTLSILATLIFAYGCFAQENYLDQVPELQYTAKLATGGAKGCGIGTITLVTSNGEIKVGTGLDPIHVFGKKIVVSEILKLLEARVESNKTGIENQMSGKVDNLVFVILSALSLSKDSTVIPIVSELLIDKDDTIRGWALIALKSLAESGNKLMDEIKNIEFPILAVISAKGRGIETPDWLKIKE